MYMPQRPYKVDKGASNPQGPASLQQLRHELDGLAAQSKPRILLVKRGDVKIGERGGRLGVLPASFNPPTTAHEALVSEALDTINFDELLLITEARAVDKDICDAPLEERIQMLLILFGDDPRISIGVSNRGLFFEKISPLRELYPADTEIHFIVGYDTMVRVLDPRYYPDREASLRTLFSEARFLVANRGRCAEEQIKELFRQEGNRHFADRISILKLAEDFADVSSTLARQNAASGKPLVGLVPHPIIEFIKQKGLYSRQGR